MNSNNIIAVSWGLNILIYLQNSKKKITISFFFKKKLVMYCC